MSNFIQIFFSFTNLLKQKTCKNALKYSRAILEIIREIINPVFKANELPVVTHVFDFCKDKIDLKQKLSRESVFG
jgi:hypothetical protein